MMDFNQIALKEYKAVMKKETEVEEMNKFLEALFTFRYLFDDLISSPGNTLYDIFCASIMHKLIFPCDIIELRGILESDQITIYRQSIALFSPQSAEEYLKEYGAFLLLNPGDLKGIYKDYGSVRLYDTPNLFIGDALLAVIINRPTTPNSIETARNILLQTKPDASFIVSNSVPGLSAPTERMSLSRELVKIAQSPTIQLTPAESSLFTKLKGLRDRAGLGGKVNMYVAGGWTRDKLMSLESDDIDIALSGMTGSDFVNRLGIGGSVIQANPDKSKHLETVKANVDGQEIDFVNLRSETYTDTRIPEMQMGTPEQDAGRRDFTINALFYNIETGQVEDFIGGLDDLQNKILRTPMEPKQTLLDDPLRALRAMRFYGRFPGFQIDPALMSALKDPQVHQEYRNRVSPERAGQEIFKKDVNGDFKGLAVSADPAKAIGALLETGLYKAVFDIPEMSALKDVKMDQQTPYHKLDVMNHTIEVIRNLDKLMIQNGESKRIRGSMVLAALFHDFGKLHPDIQKPHPEKPDQMRYIGHEDISADLADKIMKRIGIGEQERAIVQTVVSSHMRPHLDGWTPRAMGRFIRNTQIRGQEDLEVWKYVMYHAMADSMSMGHPNEEDVIDKRNKMENMQQYLTTRKQQPKSVSKPLLNGNEIMALIPELKPNTGFIRDVSEYLLELADAGEITTPEQASQKVLEWKNQNLQGYQGGKTSMNWFRKIKKADSSGGGGGGTGPGEGEFHPYESKGMFGKGLGDEIVHPQVAKPYKGTPLEDMSYMKVKHLKRYPVKPTSKGPVFEKKPDGTVHYNPVVRLPFREGDRIRDRRLGTAMKQRYGRIIRIDKNNGQYIIQWDDSNKTVPISLNDTVALAKLIAKV